MSLHKWFPPKAGEIAHFPRENPKERRIRHFWRTGFPSFWIYSLSATEEDWGDRREEQMSVFWILFFFQNSENKQTQMQIFFLEFRKKESKRPPSGPYTRFDLQTTAVCETHELHCWECKGLNHVCSKPVTWVGQRHRGRHSFTPSTQFLRPLCCTVAVTALKRCCEVPCFTAASCLCTFSSASVLCRYTTTGPPSSCRWVKA